MRKRPLRQRGITKLIQNYQPDAVTFEDMTKEKLKKPVYDMKFKMEFISKNKTPLKVTNECFLHHAFNKVDWIERIPEKKQNIIVDNYLSQFSDEEIKELQIQDVLGVDSAKLKEMEKRLNGLLDFGTEALENNETSDEERKNIESFFKFLQNNKTNLQTAILNYSILASNLHLVKEIRYSDNGMVLKAVKDEKK